jgi:hypothetical protein
VKNATEFYLNRARGTQANSVSLVNRRAMVLREECDGRQRSHEVLLTRWRARSRDGREVIIETESWFLARQAARVELKTDDVTVEEALR